jgi:hypothetical protein
VECIPVKPHLAYINNMLIKKKLAEDAKDSSSAYDQYMKRVRELRRDGVSSEVIIDELGNEIARIEKDERENDDLFFQQGVKNAKAACISAIKRITEELKGDN